MHFIPKEIYGKFNARIAHWVVSSQDEVQASAEIYSSEWRIKLYGIGNGSTLYVHETCCIGKSFPTPTFIYSPRPVKIVLNSADVINLTAGVYLLTDYSL